MNKKNYQAPVVEMLEAHVEKGFMGSGNATPEIPDGPHGTQSLSDGETYQFN